MAIFTDKYKTGAIHFFSNQLILDTAMSTHFLENLGCETKRIHPHNLSGGRLAPEEAHSRPGRLAP